MIDPVIQFLYQWAFQPKYGTGGRPYQQRLKDAIHEDESGTWATGVWDKCGNEIYGGVPIKDVNEFLERYLV